MTRVVEDLCAVVQREFVNSIARDDDADLGHASTWIDHKRMNGLSAVRGDGDRVGGAGSQERIERKGEIHCALVLGIGGLRAGGQPVEESNYRLGRG